MTAASAVLPQKIEHYWYYSTLPFPSGRLVSVKAHTIGLTAFFLSENNKTALPLLGNAADLNFNIDFMIVPIEKERPSFSAPFVLIAAAVWH